MDVDGDGRHDLVAGAELADRSGAVWVVSGPNVTGDVDSLFADATVVGAEEGDSLGARVAGLADHDGDGTGDLLHSAIGADPHGESSGRVLLAYGRLSGTVDVADLVHFDGGIPGYLGYGLADGSFDLTGDGVRDLLFGAPGPDGDVAASGSGYLLPGAAP